jgi:hypothetical protein
MLSIRRAPERLSASTVVGFVGTSGIADFADISWQYPAAAIEPLTAGGRAHAPLVTEPCERAGNLIRRFAQDEEEERRSGPGAWRLTT